MGEVILTDPELSQAQFIVLRNLANTAARARGDTLRKWAEESQIAATHGSFRSMSVFRSLEDKGLVEATEDHGVVIFQPTQLGYIVLRKREMEEEIFEQTGGIDR